MGSVIHFIDQEAAFPEIAFFFCLPLVTPLVLLAGTVGHLLRKLP